MVASRDLVVAGWAVSVAAELARSWAQATPGVVLMDTDLSSPRVHHAVGLDNAVGLGEVLRGEESVARATRVLEADRLFCVTAGKPLDAPGAAAFDGERWARLCRALAEAGVTVVAYAPASLPWIGDVLACATDVVELREQHRTLHWPRSRASVRAVLGPMSLAAGAADPTGLEPPRSSSLLGFGAATADDAAEDEQDGGSEELEEAAFAGHEPSAQPVPGAAGDPAAQDTVALGSPEVGTRSPESREGGSAPDRPARRGVFASPPRRGRRTAWSGRRLWVVAGLSAGAAAFVVAFQAGSDPGLARSNEAPSATGVTSGPETAVVAASDGGAARRPVAEPLAGRVTEAREGPGAQPIAPPLAYSVAIGSFSSMDRAESRIEVLSAATPGVPWVVTPVVVGGVPYHRVLAGLEEDSAAASGLARVLARAIPGEPDAWLIRSTRLVFDFGEWPTLAEARAQEARVRAATIPAHVARIEYSDRSVRWRVYAGGFANADEAGYLRGLIEDAGLEAPLVPRLGAPFEGG